MQIDNNSPEVQAALKLVEAYMEAECRALRVVGLSAAVVHDQEIIWSKAFGVADIETQTPTTTSTIYRIASITKLFTATMLMQLRDAGKLSLDDPIQKYWPEFKVKTRFPDQRPITLRQAISHMSGLPMLPVAEFPIPGTNPTLEEFLALAAQTDPEVPAMTQFIYSNFGFIALGVALSRAAGKPYEDCIRENILLPLSMTRTSYDPNGTLKAREATGYVVEGKATPEIPELVYPPIMRSGSGLYSTVEDLAKFISLQFRENPAGGAQVLGGSTLREMRAPVFIKPSWQQAVGIGWQLTQFAEQTVAGHMGGFPGVSSNLWIVPEFKLGIVVLSNTSTNPMAFTDPSLELLISTFSRIMSR